MIVHQFIRAKTLESQSRRQTLDPKIYKALKSYGVIDIDFKTKDLRTEKNLEFKDIKLQKKQLCEAIRGVFDLQKYAMLSK